jgi:hypothetical protein
MTQELNQLRREAEQRAVASEREDRRVVAAKAEFRIAVPVLALIWLAIWWGFDWDVAGLALGGGVFMFWYMLLGANTERKG